MENNALRMTVQGIKKAYSELEHIDVYKKYLPDLKKILQHADDPILIMVMGEFSTGKSTFINALVGENIAVVDARPTTAVITKLSYGENDTVIVYFKNGNVKEITCDEFSKLTAINNENAYNTDEILYVERLVPVEFLKNVNIIDSPGLNDINKSHNEITQSFIKNCDTVLWMFSAIKPGSDSEIKALEGLTPRLKPIAVVNKMDQLDEDEDDPDEFIANIKCQLGNRVQTVVGISAKYAFEGKLQNNKLKTEIGNLAALEEAINTYVLPFRESLKMNSLMDETGVYLDNVMYDLSTEFEKMQRAMNDDYAAGMRMKQDLLYIEEYLGFFGNVLKNYCEEMAGLKNPQALFLLGVLYDNGIGVVENKEKAQSLYEQAAFKKHMQAIINLVVQGKKMGNTKQAMYWSEQAAELGGQEEIYHYACMLFEDKQFSKANLYFQKSSICGNLDACYKLAQNYFQGRGCAIDYPKALTLFLKTSDYIPMAKYYIYVMYKKGLGTEQNDEEAFKWLLNAAHSGISKAEFILGKSYYEGEAVEQNFTEAFRWMQKASEKELQASYYLALLYLHGQGIDQNVNRAIMLLNNASNAGDADSMYLLAEIYYKGIGVAKDIKLAFKYYDSAAKLGNEKAISRLNTISRDVNNSNGDERIALEALTIAAKANDLEAQFKLGLLYKRKDSIYCDYDKAFKLIENAALSGHQKARYELGLMYQNGLGTNQNYVKAISCFKEAASHNVIEALYSLGVTCEKGLGVQQDLNMALKFYAKAAQNDYPMAIFAIGKLYHIRNDYTNALSWFIKASNKEVGIAERFIGDYCIHGLGVEIDFNKAVQWYKQGATHGDDVSAVNVAKCYTVGLGVPQNNQIAMQWYIKAARNGSSFALAVCTMMSNDETAQYEDAVRILVEFDEKGDSVAADLLGVAYYYGKGVEKNTGLALEYWKKAADNKNTKAKIHLADHYSKSRDVERQELAKKLYMQAVYEGNDGEAYTKLSLLYWCIDEKDKALRFLYKANERLDSVAKIIVESNLYNEFSIEGFNNLFNVKFEGVLKMLMQYVRMNNVEAILYFADIYENNKFGFNNQRLECLKLYEKAANRNNEFAKNKIGEIYKNLAHIYFSKNKTSKAFNCLELSDQFGNKEARSMMFEMGHVPSFFSIKVVDDMTEEDVAEAIAMSSWMTRG